MVGFTYIIVLLTVLSLEFIDRYHSLFIVFCYIVYLIARSIYLHPNDIDSPKEQIKEFLAGRWKWFKSLRALKQAYLIIAGIIGITLLILFLRLYLELFLFEWNDPKIKDNSIRDLAIAFFGTISGIGALFGVYLAILRSEENTRQNKIANDQSEIADKQAITAEQGLITDRINKATEGLGKTDKDGNPVIEVRLGALYALERIAKDSERDHVSIIELFCAYIRTNSSNNDPKTTAKPLREDIKIILRIIGRRETWSKDKSRLEIERTQGMHLNLFNCYLKGAEAQRTNLSGANFYKANLENAWLNGANLSNARLLDVSISGATLTGVKTNGAHARNGDFSGCPTLTQKQIDVMYCGIDVKIPNGLNRPGHWPPNYLTGEEFKKSRIAWKKTQK